MATARKSAARPKSPRELVDDAWVYADPDEQSAAIAFLLRGFNLAAFDSFLEEDGWNSPKAQANRAQLLEKRGMAIAAYSGGRLTEALGWLNFLQAAMQTARTLGKLGAQQAAKRKKVSETNAKNAQQPRAATHDPAEIRAEHARLIQGGHTDREARGLLVSRGTLGSQATIRRALGPSPKKSSH